MTLQDHARKAATKREQVPTADTQGAQPVAETFTVAEWQTWTGIKIDPNAPWLKRYDEAFAKLFPPEALGRGAAEFKIPRRSPYRRAKVVEAAPPRPIKEAEVYVIQSGDFVKIGWSSNVTKRLQKIATITPTELTLLHTMPGGWREERALHERFATCRHRGEWFRVEGALAEWIAAGFPSPTPIAREDLGK